jgi:hypothetical protein
VFSQSGSPGLGAARRPGDDGAGDGAICAVASIAKLKEHHDNEQTWEETA